MKKDENPLLSGDDIWALQGELQKLIDRADGDTKRVLQLAREALATAGTMEDRKFMARNEQGRERPDNVHR